MKWILIVITFSSPNVTVSQYQMEFETEQDCLDQQYLIEEQLARRDDGLNYQLWCFDESLEIEYD